ncbi:MAG: hypothetical protein ACI8ZQ_001295 [Bacteroidia bacterium]|jgi:hypothetical protein
MSQKLKLVHFEELDYSPHNCFKDMRKRERELLDNLLLKHKQTKYPFATPWLCSFKKNALFKNRLMSTSIAMPISGDPVDDSRLRKYSVCLHLVKKVLDKELATSISPSIFHTIGSVACFIDQQLDSLCIDQQKQLA